MRIRLQIRFEAGFFAFGLEFIRIMHKFTALK